MPRHESVEGETPKRGRPRGSKDKKPRKPRTPRVSREQRLEMVMAALKSQHGHTKAAAEVLGIERSVLSHHLRKLNLTGEPARLREVYRRRFLFPKF